MNDTRIESPTHSLPAYAAAFLTGLPLLLLIRLIERGWQTNLLASSLIEEGMKVCLFLALCLLLRLAKGRFPGAKEPELLPFLCIIGFAVGENSLFFFYAPTTTIYQRLLYSYPLHLNTGLFYAWIFLILRSGNASGRRRTFFRILIVCLGVCIAAAYHFFLNVAALVITDSAVYLIGGINILALILLFLVLHRKRIERSLIHAGL
jgi:hypothetical protein